MALFVFKTVADQFSGRVSYFKVMSGIVKNDANLVTVRSGSQERLAHLSVLKGKTLDAVTELHAGDLGADPQGGRWLLATIERVQLTRVDAMRRRFRFTRTQAKLAEMLCEGMRPTHAAEALGVKISTVRTHVGQMYEKTGTHSQAQLVALLHAV